MNSNIIHKKITSSVKEYDPYDLSLLLIESLVDIVDDDKITDSEKISKIDSIVSAILDGVEIERE